jgi:hypothetical protein
MNTPPQGAQPITTQIHKPFCDFSQDPTLKRKGYGMPRDWLKSTTLTCWRSIWAYLQNIEIRQLLAMENERLGMAKLNFISAQLLRNQKLRKIYWDKLHLVNDSWIRKHRWSQTQIELPREGMYSEPTIMVVGIGGAAQSGHYDHIYLDDIIGQAALDSKVIMEGAWRWFDNVNELLVEPAWRKENASTVHIIGSPWGPGDIYDYTKTQYPEYRWVIAPCQKDDELEDTKKTRWIQNPDVAQGESNWDQFPTHYYEEMASNPEKQAIYWAQHMCNPTKAAGLNKFDKRYLKYFKWGEDEEGYRTIICMDDKEEFRLHSIPLYEMIDPGGFAEIKTSKGGSKDAKLVGGQPRDSMKKFIVYAKSGRFKRPRDFIKEVFSVWGEFHPRTCRIDKVGTQSYIYSHILEMKEDKEMKKEYPSIRNLSISEIPPDTKKDSKDSDIQALIHPMANGEIYVHESMYDLIREIEQYPHGLTKDLIDLCGKLNKLYWTRQPIDKTLKRMKRHDRELDRMRDPVSGY